MARSLLPRLALLGLALAGGLGAALAATPSPDPSAGSPPGTRFQVDVADLPTPGATPSVADAPLVVPRPAGAGLAVPAGYAASLVAEQLEDPRNLLALPDGSLLVAESRPGRLVRLANGALPQVVADGFDTPYGLALTDGLLWVADLEGVWQLPWPAGQQRPGERRRITPPGALGGTRGHVTRSLAVAPDGRHFYVGIGSAANLDVEAPPRATVQEFDGAGSGGRTLASGLRNPVGLAFRPGTGELWTVVNERDHQGDGLVPDYLTAVVPGAFYGWPYAYLGPHPQPGFADRDPAKVAATRRPDLLFRSHSAPLGLAFWHGDAFVALHGSWNSSRPQGGFVARVPLAGGRPQGGYEAFATGFRLGEEDGRARVWGRPAGLAVGTDDALYICDDAGGTVWRITAPK